ncbi:hypothetical protein HK097_008609 [Rhizophlyctis rosea]|uniref:Uncharacterized protein n=1 Tax=Rhizophlyctis rosea TaxID=64517 RepID=A0AAD5X1L4_9FUNG|nr:hypothetical protein HK097_008609 [Rhizophlyctis rosea]
MVYSTSDSGVLVGRKMVGSVTYARLRLELHSRLRNASAPTTGILQCLWRVATKSVSTSSESLSHKAPGDFRKLESPFFTLRRLESMTYYVISGFFSLLISSFLMVEADGLTSASTDASILFQTSGFDASTCLQGNWADRAVQRGLANLRAEKEKDDNRKYVPLVYALKEADAGLDHPFVVAGFGDGLSVWSDATAEETATYGETGWWVACSETECYAYHAPNGTDMTTVNRNAVNVTAVREAFFQLAVIDPVLLALSRAGSLEQDEKVLGKTNGTAASSSGARKPGITWGIVTGLTNDQSSNTYRTGFLVSRACSVQRSTIAKQMPSKAQGLSRVFTFRSYTPSKVTVLLPGKVIWYPAFAPWIIIAFTVSCGVVAVLPHLMVGVLGSGREDDDEKKWKSVVALTQDGAVGLLAGGRLDVTTTAEGKLVVTD